MKYWKYIFLFLTLALAALIAALFQLPDEKLHIVACDVGQGDAILIYYKNIQILTDGGPDNKVLACLGSRMPFWDRRIELVVSTHPDADHSTGLLDVIKKYNVGKILIGPKDPGTQVYEALRNEVGGRGVDVINPVRGMELGIDLIRLDILSDFDSLNPDTNFNSIVYRLRFGGFAGLFLADIPPAVSEDLAGRLGPVNYIKIPHHGSANGLTENLLKAVVPGGASSSLLGIISVGRKNIWGFPSPKTIEILEKYGVQILRTDLNGDVEVATDGKKYWTRLGVQKN